MNRISINDLTSQQLDELYTRAEQLEELLRIAEETSSRSEAERARAVQRAEQAEAAVERARETCRRIRAASVLADGLPHTSRARGAVMAADRVLAALGEQPAPAEAQTAALQPQEQR